MEEKKKILIITYYWPPSGGAGVQRWLKFAKYLPEFGVEPIILTVDPKYASYPQRDESLEKDIRSDLKVFKTKSFEPLNLLSGLFGKKNVPYGGFTNVNKQSFLQTVLRFIRGNFFIPDARIGWNRYAYKKAKEIIKEYNIETVITTSPPHSTQLIGLKLKKNLNINWIADFRDPWTDIYYYKDLLHTGFAKRLDKKKELKVLEGADRVIVVGKSLKEKFYHKVLQDKITVISNGFDEEDFTGIVQKPDVFTITYTGTLSDQYNISTFIEACKELKSKGINFIIRFVGNISDYNLNGFKTAGLFENLEIVTYVPHQKSIEYLFKSSVLLLVIPDFVGNKEILTGKLFEYIATQIPIIGIGPKDGDAAEVISLCKSGEFFDCKNSEEIAKYIIGLRHDWVAGIQNETNHVEIKKLSRKFLTGQVVKLI
ncbi:MAG TPA: hypothetical protein DCG75_18910 [Bacteroidales bacterium]|nr:hypothetical protein [Bacteroidales bacterium]